MTRSTTSQQHSEQLALLSEVDLPIQFKLDQRTRQRGLAHVAALRAQLAARAAARQQHPAEQAA